VVYCWHGEGSERYVGGGGQREGGGRNGQFVVEVEKKRISIFLIFLELFLRSSWGS
jgi:hypothetical protein